ncbi:hypothetical protein phytr_10050 [Candidatus Phycorickettsia trachydisci]|uniref:Uncharacterized protein n=1 Tax=Candidatus Phycorickettsia trachydisci TaxID=2115978 RepID=A0A2P1P9I8_9RICK|nr:hypothetical protein phytr_10050 [Candidatus Phycorickettsia trachydisci]
MRVSFLCPAGPKIPSCNSPIIVSSGSGKSTLLHIADLLDDADSGTVLIANNPKLSKRSSVCVEHF